jgi:hypothetical protein
VSHVVIASVAYLDQHTRDLSERLNLSREDGEKWIVNLIRDTRMGADARIDLEKVCITSRCQEIIELISICATECYRNQSTSVAGVPNSN